MVNPISQVRWVEKNMKLDALLHREATLSIHPLEQGFEAEVTKISMEQESYVLKVWNKSSKPDIQSQFHVLNRLYEQGISVTQAIGWGIDPNSNQVLLMNFGGNSILKLNANKIKAMAQMLSQIHQINVSEIEASELEGIRLLKYDFIDYFFPSIREQDDLYHVLTSLLELISIKQESLIHGDFHLGNILEDEEKGRFTVIDWTNAQWGDARYDFAWSLVLQKIYVSDRYANVFRSAYCVERELLQEELEVFEALACLRWILLKRSGGVPQGPHILKSVRSLITSNRFLKGVELHDFPIKMKVYGGQGMNLDTMFNQFPTLQSDQIMLKKIEAQHVNEVFEIYNNDNVFEYCGILPKHNKDTVQTMIGHFERDYNKRSKVKWGIFAPQEADALLGIIEVFDINSKVNKVTIGYFLAESHWGKGIATRAVGVLLEFLFTEVNVNRIQAEVMLANENSKRVLLKNGFIHEGTLRQANLWSGKGIVDLEIYSILNEDYTTIKSG